jgi:hypothetical protein
MKRGSEIPHWFPLDVAGTIYPSARTRNWNYTYRSGFLLKEEVNPGLLRQALEDIHSRFPSFFVGVRNGLFWYYLERMENLDIVRRESTYPCRPMNIFSRQSPAIRILYDHRRFCLEIAHCVADGGATLTMAKALLARYLQLTGKEIPPDSGLTDLTEPPKPEELTDSYREFYVKKVGKPAPDANAWQYRPPQVLNYLKVIHGILPLEDVLPAAKARGITLTDYLMAVYLYAFYLAVPKSRRSSRQIKVSVPISLRNFFPTETLRNFSLFTNIGFDPRAKADFSFDDVLEAVKGKLAAAKTKEAMQKLLSSNVAMIQNPLVRLIPNVLKRRVLQIGYVLAGENKFTTPMTNLGRVTLPPGVAEHVEQVEGILGGSAQKRINCAMISDERFLHIYFSGDTKRTEVQREFFRLLAREGIRARVECNIREEEDVE